MKSLNQLDEGFNEVACILNAGVALVANATSKTWDLAVDATIDGPEKWYAQIEGRYLYLYFEIDGPQMVEEALNFIDSRRSGGDKQGDKACCDSDNELVIGRFADSQVSLIWDNEGVGRCFFSVGQSGNFFFQCKVSGVDLERLAAAFRQLQANLKRDSLNPEP